MSDSIPNGGKGGDTGASGAGGLGDDKGVLAKVVSKEEKEKNESVPSPLEKQQSPAPPGGDSGDGDSKNPKKKDGTADNPDDQKKPETANILIQTEGDLGRSDGSDPSGLNPGSSADIKDVLRLDINKEIEDEIQAIKDFFGSLGLKDPMEKRVTFESKEDTLGNVIKAIKERICIIARDYLQQVDAPFNKICKDYCDIVESTSKFRDTVAYYEGESQIHQNSYSALASEVALLEDNYNSIAGEVDALEDRKNSCHRAINDLSERKDENEKIIGNLEKDLKSLQDTNDRLRRWMDTEGASIKRDIESLKIKNKELEKSNNLARAALEKERSDLDIENKKLGNREVVAGESFKFKGFGSNTQASKPGTTHEYVVPKLGQYSRTGYQANEGSGYVRNYDDSAKNQHNNARYRDGASEVSENEQPYVYNNIPPMRQESTEYGDVRGDDLPVGRGGGNNQRGSWNQRGRGHSGQDKHFVGQKYQGYGRGKFDQQERPISDSYNRGRGGYRSTQVSRNVQDSHQEFEHMSKIEKTSVPESMADRTGRFTDKRAEIGAKYSAKARTVANTGNSSFGRNTLDLQNNEEVAAFLLSYNS